ncbi:hypothetical protein MBLNU457_g0559t1 [Dothideomycetes sp. NU457]
MASALQSPLTQQARPDVFEPKIVQSYKQLFRNVEDEDSSEGFWKEFFLLKPDVARLCEILDDTSADFLLHVQHHPQQLFAHAIAAAKSGQAPADENALETLAVFLNKVLSKKYQSPSADIIEVLAGLDHVDVVFTDLVTTLDVAIQRGRTVEVRQKAVQVAISLCAGAFQTSLLTYFTQRDLFPGLMKLIYDAGTPQDAAPPLVLSGVLANYNRFESHNPYQARFGNFSNMDTIKKLAGSIGGVCDRLRDNYVAIQNDLPEAWSVGATLSYIGLGSLIGAKTAPAAPTEEQAKVLFSEQPQQEAAILLAVYDFIHSNKTVGLQLLSNIGDEKHPRYGLSGLLSFASYLLQHAHRSTRAALYAHLILIILQIVVEDSALTKRLTETSTSVRLCRQRPPYLPITKADRPLAATVMDVMIDCINHNLRTKLDVGLYETSIAVIRRLLSFLTKTRTRLSYHWPELWRALLSFVRFLTQYAEQLKGLPDIESVVHGLVNLLALCLTQGEVFVQDNGAMDDLFYKIVESSAQLSAFKDAYQLKKSPVADSMATLNGASEHFKDSLNAANGKTKNVSPSEVMKAIKSGYETLAINAREGTDQWHAYRESDHKVELKRIARVVAADARLLGMPTG